MGFLDTLKGLFKGLDYGNVNPDDVEAFVRLEHELDQARYKGDAAIAAAHAKFGLTDAAHAEKVIDALAARHGQNPEFVVALERVRAEHQQQMMDAAMKGPPQR